VAVLAGAAAYFTTRGPVARETGSSLGSPVLPDLPLNRVESVVIQSGSQSLTLAREENLWRVRERFGYPADFDRLRQTMRELADLKIGQLIHLERPQWADLGLTHETGARTVELRDGAHTPLATLTVGRAHMRRVSGTPAGGPSEYPDGRYLAVGDAVYLVSQTLDRLTDDATAWLDRTFLDVSSADITAITISGPDRNTVRLIRGGEQEEWTLETLPDGRTHDATMLNRVTAAISYLSFADVADPSLSSAETGLASATTYEALTRQGITYTVRVGDADPQSGRRFASVSIHPPAPAPAADGESETMDLDSQDPDIGDEKVIAEATRLRAKLDGWIYCLEAYQAESLKASLDDLLADIMPEPGPRARIRHRSRAHHKTWKTNRI
jgi:hypothetical protein